MAHLCVLKSNNYADKMLEGFKELFDSELSLDVELVDSAGDIVRAHMLVLSAVSPILRTFVQPATIQHQQLRLQFGGITADQWRAVLKFLYTGELIVEIEQVEELYNAVSQLQLQELEGLLQKAKEQVPQVLPESLLLSPTQPTTTTAATTTTLSPEQSPPGVVVTEQDLPPAQHRKNNKPRLPVNPTEKFQGPFGEVEFGNYAMSESEKLLRINQAFGHVTVHEDALMSLEDEENEEEEGEGEDREEGGVNMELLSMASYKVEQEQEEEKPKFKCEKCDALVEVGKDLEEHIEAHALCARIVEVKCSQCPKQFLTVEDLKAHEVNKHTKKKEKITKKIQQCRFCRKIFSFQHLVDKHIIKEHLEESGFDLKAIACEYCELTFPTEVLQNYHLKRSHASILNNTQHRRTKEFFEPKPCPICQTNAVDLTDHMRSTHPDAPAYSCSYCGAMFTKLRSRKEHVEKSHRQVSCKYCKITIQNHSKLLKHLPLCEKAPDAHREAWSRKIKDAHARIYNCTHCSLKFRALNHLRKHEKEAHGTYQELQCHICLKKIPSNCGFKDHIMRHLGLRPFTCQHCPKSFTSASDRTRHVKTMHAETTNAMPYKCHLCPKAFRDCSNFYAHGKKAHRQSFKGLVQKARQAAQLPPQMTSVAEIRVKDLYDQLKKECSGSHRDPGVCPICQKLFTKRSNLFTHGRKLHKINYTHLLKGKYSKYTFLGEIVKETEKEGREGDENEDEDEQEQNEDDQMDEQNEESTEPESLDTVETILKEEDAEILTLEEVAQLEFIEEEEEEDDTPQNVLPPDDNYEDTIEMIEMKSEEVENVQFEGEGFLVEDENGTLIRVFQMPVNDVAM